MKNLKLLIALLVSGVLLTGCFDMIEEVEYNRDGSGTYTFKMDMGEMKEMIAMLAAMDTTGTINMDTMDMVSKELAAKVAGTKGITDIEKINDRENYVFGVSFDFEDIASLNNAVHKIFSNDELRPDTDTPGQYFDGKRKKFERRDAAGFGTLVQEMMGQGEDAKEEDIAMAKMFLNDVTYTTIYHFKRKVKEMSNDEAELSDDKKTVTLKYFIFDKERSGKTSTLENTIKLR